MPEAAHPYRPAGVDYTLLVWACFIFLALNVFVFTCGVASEHIRHDLFRHLENIVIPLMEGSQGVSILWSNHHPSPLLHILQIANVKLFSLRLEYDAYLGIACQVLSTFLILRYALYPLQYKTQKVGLIGILCAMLMMAIAFGFNTLEQYTWPLVATVQYLYLFGLILFLAVDAYLRVQSRPRLLLVAGSALLCVFANADYGTVFVVAVLAVLALSYILEREMAYLRAIGILLLVFGVYQIFLSAIQPPASAESPSSTIPSIQNLLGRPWYVLKSFSLGLSTGLVDTLSLKARYPKFELWVLAGAVFNTLAFVAIFATYFVRRLYRVSTAPVALMLMAALFSASILVFRWWAIGGDDWGLASSRYVPTFKLAVMGALWALWLIMREQYARTGVLPGGRAAAVTAVAVIGLLLVVQASQILSGWREAPEIRSENQRLALGVYLAGNVPENKVRLPVRIAGLTSDGRNVPMVLAYLKEHKLNVFADNAEPGDLLDQYLQARHQFSIGQASPVISAGSAGHGEVLSPGGEVQASWERHPGALQIDNRANASLYLRIEARANRYSSNALWISDSSVPTTHTLDVFGGRQVLYFEVGGGQSLGIAAQQGATLGDFELRPQ